MHIMNIMNKHVNSEEQQLKLAMARSMQEDDEYPDDAEISDELDSQSDYINMTVSDSFIWSKLVIILFRKLNY